MKKVINILLILSILLVGKSGWAEDMKPDLEVSVEMPLAGIYKNNKMVRFEIHMKNDGKPFSGEISLKRMEMGIAYPASHSVEVGLDSGEEKDVVLDINSDSLMGGNQPIGISVVERGKEIKWVPVLGAQQHHQWVVGALSEKPNDYHFLSLIQPGDRQGMSVIALEAKDIPDHSSVLDNLDILAIGDLPEGLTSEQVDAIREWVNRGGILIVSGGISYAETKKMLGDWLPYRSAEVGLLQVGEELTQRTQMAPPEASVEGIKEAQQLFHVMKMGEGMIMAVAYDISEEPLASWQGNKKLWQQVIEESLYSNLLMQESGGMINYGLRDISYMSPGVNSPNFPLIASLWVLYILAVSPVLYFVLKRMDKREWAWGIIPLLSLTLTAGVYFLGRYQIAEEDTVHTASIVHIVSKDMAEVDSSVSFLMIEGGDYYVEQASGGMYVPRTMGGNQLDRVSVMEDGKLHFQGVPYLSMEEAYAKSLRNDVGQIDSHIYVENEQLKGYLTNQTAFDLKEVVLTVGLQQLAIGDLAKGAKVEVSEKLERVYLPPVTDEMQRTRKTVDRWEQLKSGRMQSMSPIDSIPMITVAGITEQGFEVFDVIAREETSYFSTIVRQEVELEPTPGGKKIFPYGTLPVRLGDNKGSWEGMPNGYNLMDGFLNFALKVKPDRVDVKNIEIPLNEKPYKPFMKKLYNVKTARWEKLADDEAIILKGEEQEQYVTPQGEVILRFENNTGQKLFLPFPYFLVEGEVKQDD